MSDAKDVLWDECGEHLEAKQQRQYYKSRSKKDAITNDILDALYSLDNRRMMPLFAIDPSGIGQIPKHNPDQRHIVKHSTDSTNDASTAEHLPTKQTVNELSRSAPNKKSLQPYHPQSNKRTTREPSGFPVNTSGSNKGRIKDAKIPYYFMVLLKVETLLVDYMV